MKKLYLLLFFLACIVIDCKKSSTPKPPVVPKTYTITATSNNGGSITPAGKYAVAAGSNLTYTITPSASYGILALTVDSIPVVPVTDTYTFSNVGANHTINATFAPKVNVHISVTNGTWTSYPLQAIAGGSMTLTITPNTWFLTDSLLINGTFIKLLADATTYTVNNITANEAIKVTCTDAIHQKQLDSISNLIIGQWTMVQLNSKLGNLQDTFLPWDVQPFAACSSNQFDQFYANGVFQRNNNPAACDPLAYPNQQQFVPRPLDHWKLNNYGTAIYMTDPPLDSLVNITVTKDSLIAFYYGGFTSTDGISYKYHYARKH